MLRSFPPVTKQVDVQCQTRHYWKAVLIPDSRWTLLCSRRKYPSIGRKSLTQTIVPHTNLYTLRNEVKCLLTQWSKRRAKKTGIVGGHFWNWSTWKPLFFRIVYEPYSVSLQSLNSDNRWHLSFCAQFVLFARSVRRLSLINIHVSRQSQSYWKPSLFIFWPRIKT